MVTSTIDPILFQSGAVTVRWFGVLIVLAIVVALVLGVASVRRAGLDAERFLGAAAWAIAFGLIGARLFHVVDQIDYYLPRLSQVPIFSEGGLSLVGALVVGGLAGAIALQAPAKERARYFDAATIPVLIAIAIGRIANLLNGDPGGAPTDLIWGVTYLHPRAASPSPDVAVHPYPVYEMIGLLMLVLVVRALTRPGRPWAAPGGRFLLALGGYGLLRLLEGLVRTDPVLLLGLQQAQWFGLLAILPAVAWWLRRRPALVARRAGG